MIREASGELPNIWGVALDGILHFDGYNWRLAEKLPSTVDLHAIEVAGPRAWAVGQCDVMTLSGGQWSLESLPWDCSLKEVAIAEDEIVWAGGSIATRTGQESLLIKYENNKWTRVSHPTAMSVESIFLSDDVAIIGLSRRDSSFIAQFSAGAWSILIDGLEFPIRDIDGIAADDLWAVGGLWGINGRPRQAILHYDGTEWESVLDEQSADSGALTSVQMIDAETGWAAGEYQNIYKYENSEWSRIHVGWTLRPDWTITDVVPLGPGEVWFMGSIWSMINIRGETLSLWGGARGGGIPDSIDNALTGIVMTSTEEGWAIGARGPLLHRVPSKGWIEETCYVCRHMTGLVAEADEVWAWSSYETGWLAMHDGDTWREVDVPATLPNRELLLDDGVIWLVTSTGTAADTWLSELWRSVDGVWTRVGLWEDLALEDVTETQAGVYLVGAAMRHDGVPIGAVLVPQGSMAWELMTIESARGGLTQVKANDDDIWALGPTGLGHINSVGEWRQELLPRDMKDKMRVFRNLEILGDYVVAIGDYGAWRGTGGVWEELRMPHIGSSNYRWVGVDAVGDESTAVIKR